jgi:hypothetical protein
MKPNGNDPGKMETRRYDYMYRVYGLTIGSSIEIPELLPVHGDLTPDVIVQPGSVPGSLENPKAVGARFQAEPGRFLLNVDNIARYLVSAGSRVTIEISPGADERDIRLFLLGSALGALIHQRGLLPLHASAVKVENRCVLFCGISGSGKSTTAKALINRGYHLHADDICVVSEDEAKQPLVYPGYPHLKLWEHALEKIGLESSAYSRVRGVLDKFSVPVSDRFNPEPLPIKKIYVLAPWNREDIEIQAVTGMAKFNVLKRHTYRFRFIEGLDSQVSHFKTSGIVGNKTPLARVRRPRGLFMLDELIDRLEHDFSEDDS